MILLFLRFEQVKRVHTSNGAQVVNRKHLTFCSTALQTNSNLSGVISRGRSNGVPMSSPSSLLN